ncbi:MAG: hypothetical protein GY847_39850 [Proteobacteria bacterium]|nr:hypothetical protein [Pseudomonadota bacterium]
MIEIISCSDKTNDDEDARSDTDTNRDVDTNTDTDTETTTDPDTGSEEPLLKCAEVYTQDEVVTFEIEIDLAEWRSLKDEWANWSERGEQGLTIKPYHPLVTFQYNDTLIKDAQIRLKGSYLNWEKSPEKMQFNISFKGNDGSGRFQGLRKVNLDAPHNDPSLLKDRLGMAIFRDLGVPAPCVNHVRLIVNGKYYGIFSNIEHVDQEFLERNFGKKGDAEEGNLYKYMEKKTNELDPDTSDLDYFMADLSISEIANSFDLGEVILEWAGEAVLPHVDGYWVGGINYYVYFHPIRGMLMIPWDIDYSFDVATVAVDPVTYEVGWGNGKPGHITTVVGDDEWRQKYFEAIEKVIEKYKPKVIQERIDSYAAQIAQAMEEDLNKPYTTEEHTQAVTSLRQYVEDRYGYVQNWLDCEAGLGKTDSAEHDSITYIFRHSLCSWENASGFCQEQGGRLVVPQNEVEQSFLATKAQEFISDNCWTGINDYSEEGIWTGPNDEEVSYLPWASGQPNGDETQNCVVLDYNLDGGWNDKSCDEDYPAICEIR